MNRLAFKNAWPLLVLASFAAGTFVCRAGDAIILPTDKAKGEILKALPDKEIPGTREKPRVWDSLPAADPRSMEGLTRPSLRNPRKKTNEEKRQQMEQDQKRNWLLLRPDQLRDEQEQKEHLPFPDRDADAEQRGERRDYTFHGLAGPKEAREGTRLDFGRGNTEESDSGGSRTASPPNQSGLDRGAHTSKDLDLRDVFGPSQDLKTGDVGRSDPMWRGFLGSDGPTRSREQQINRLEKLGSSLVLDPKWSSELGRPPSTPTFNKSLDVPARSSGNSGFGPNQDFGALSAPRSPFAQGLPDWNAQRSPAASRAAPSSPGYNPLQQQPVNRPSVIRPTVLEIPQRKL